MSDFVSVLHTLILSAGALLALRMWLANQSEGRVHLSGKNVAERLQHIETRVGHLENM